MDYMDKILNSDSVSIHVRRGDFVTLGWAFPLEQYRRFVDEFIGLRSDQGSLFVFSDDIAWCRENREALGFNRFRHTYFVEGNMGGQNYRDLQLMSQCKSMIMSSSSFCYLAALLNTNRQFLLNRTIRKL